ncbi:MAG: dCTP deaminase [Candidatus Hodarchaeota archaeon]
MILAREDIIEALKAKEIQIIPFKDESAVGPCSVDLHLSDHFTVFKTGNVLSPGNQAQITANIEDINTGDRPFLLSPGQFILASTQEKIAISKRFAATLQGRSSIARMGVVVQAAGLVNPGTGLKKPSTLTLEVFCQANQPVELIPGIPIIQIIFHQLTRETAIGYDERDGSQYIGLESPRL